MEGTSVSAAGVRNFKARPRGNASTENRKRFVVIAAAGLGFLLILIWLLGLFLPPWVPMMVGGIILLVALIQAIIWTLVIAGADRTANGVHYEVTNDELRLFGGPVHYEIPLSSIKRVYKRDLDMSVANRPTSRVTGVQLPDLALGPVQYKDTGSLKMCATSSWRDITLIETTGETYGVTPENEEEFRAAISAKG